MKNIVSESEQWSLECCFILNEMTVYTYIFSYKTAETGNSQMNLISEMFTT